jgi:hypothetical protein
MTAGWAVLDIYVADNTGPCQMNAKALRFILTVTVLLTLSTRATRSLGPSASERIPRVNAINIKSSKARCLFLALCRSSSPDALEMRLHRPSITIESLSHGLYHLLLVFLL